MPRSLVVMGEHLLSCSWSVGMAEAEGVKRDDVSLCLVTGGRGFLGRHLVRMLLDSEQWVVRIADLAPEVTVSEKELLSPLGRALLSGRACYILADLRNREHVFAAVKGAAVVFHLAAPDPSVNDYKLHHAVNVIGTRNVIDACLELGVKKLVYTSSPSAVFDGVHDIINGDESLPYPAKHIDSYSKTKAQAEALVLNANGKQGLVTCALRPSGIFGPGDRLMVPSLVEAAKAGKLKFIIGNGKNMFDWTYVENVAHAHICAEQALVPGAFKGEDVASGKAYFITNGEHRSFWDFLFEILEGLGYPRPPYHLPVEVALPLAILGEWSSKQLAPFGVPMTRFTPSRVRYTSVWRTFNCQSAERYLKYFPRVGLEEGIHRTIQAYWHLRSETYHVKSRGMTISKSQTILGGGKVADVLMWRNVSESCLVLMGLVFAYTFLFRSGHTLLSAGARAILTVLTVVFIYGHLLKSISGYDVQQLFETPFQISEGSAHRVAHCVTNCWNFCASKVVSAIRDRNWSLLFKILLVLRVLKFLGRISMQGLIGAGIPLMFTIPYIYEVREKEIDGFLNFAQISFIHYKSIFFRTKLKASY